MSRDGLSRLLLFSIVAAAHIAVILLVAFTADSPVRQVSESSGGAMRLTDFAEYVPAPPAPPPPQVRAAPLPEEIPPVETIAETFVETETLPEQNLVDPGSLAAPAEAFGSGTSGEGSSWDDFLPAHRVSEPPSFDEREIAAALIYPPIALRSGVQGRVILELFVDRSGTVQLVRILREEPEGRGFGEAAVRAFSGRQGRPAVAEGHPVSARFRYPVSFRIR
ncbi:MAG: energy transducer TonB [Treponema sp.]|nr:energy transducer TonB [Treponema sp.]